jgi:predicted transcriptional regulator
MKTTIKEKMAMANPMAEAKKNQKFSIYAKDAAAQIRLGVEIYNIRTAEGISQQKLAKITKTTQKMISNIENGSVDIRFSTLNKIKEALDFKLENLAIIHDLPVSISDNRQIKFENNLIAEKILKN